MYSLCRHGLFMFTSLIVLLLSTSISAQSSCTPLNCVAQCQPECSGAQVCVLSTMTNCGQCPASKCISPSLLGISSPSDNNNSHTGSTGNEQQQQQQQQGNNDSLIGGLVGGLVGGGFLIGGLAFCIYRSRKNMLFTSSLEPIIPQHQQQQQQQQLCSISDINKSIIHSSLSDIPRSLLETTRESTCHSITSGVIPIAYIPPSKEMQQCNHSSYINNTTVIAMDNPFRDPHHISTHDNDDDDDMSSRHHSILSADQHASHYAIQATRAKPQILRVSSLKRTGSGSTLSTKLANHGEDISARSNNGIDLAATGDQNPFQNNNNASTVNRHNDDDDDIGSSRPSTNHSLGSTLGDGEITIFWHGQQQQQQQQQHH